MFFTKVGKVLAYIIFALGVLRVALGLLIAFGAHSMTDNAAAARQYLGASNTGEAINEGTIYILVAVALGILCEISLNRRNYAASDSQAESDKS